MIKWPEKLRNGKEAGKLPGIGPSISAKLDDRLKQHQTEFGIISEIPEGTVLFVEEEAVKPTKNPKTARNLKTYVPTYRSAPYSVLLALLLHLHENNQNGPLKKSDLIMKAQVFCTSSLSDGMFPSINGALKILEEKELIRRLGTPPHFILTSIGVELGEKLWQKGEKRPSQSFHEPLSLSRLQFEDEASDDCGAIDNSTGSVLETFTWPAGSFEVVLLIDVREIRSREDRNYLSDRLNQLGIPSEVRNLELGDFIWVAKKKASLREGVWTDTEEIVLDTLIERKREDDLISSISDGRFREQKHRISRSQLSSTFYLVERGGSGGVGNDFLGGGDERLLCATLQCQVIDGLMYRQTCGLDESIVFLSSLHNHLKAKYLNIPITSCSLKACEFNFKEFPKQFSDLKIKRNNSDILMNYTAYALLNSKSTNQSSIDIFLLQLLTIKGLTFVKACEILKEFKSPLELYQFYQGLPNESAKRDAFKQLGAALSKKIYQVFCQKE